MKTAKVKDATVVSGSQPEILKWQRRVVKLALIHSTAKSGNVKKKKRKPKGWGTTKKIISNSQNWRKISGRGGRSPENCATPLSSDYKEVQPSKTLSFVAQPLVGIGCRLIELKKLAVNLVIASCPCPVSRHSTSSAEPKFPGGDIHSRYIQQKKYGHGDRLSTGINRIPKPCKPLVDCVLRK
jgi:hypothetical protein